MNDSIEALKAKLLYATELIQQIASERNRRTGRTPNTEHDYLRLGQTLLMRAKTTDGGLIGAVSNTLRPTTFQKRISALRFTLQSRQLELLDSIVEPVTADLAGAVEASGIVYARHRRRAGDHGQAPGR